LELLPTLAEASFHACVTDPPYHLTSIVKRFGSPTAAPAGFGTDGAFARASRGFMGKVWDGGDVAFRPETWAAVLRVLKPGAHLAAFSGTRTYHRMVCAIEDAGFEIRDQLAWVFGSGFPKSHDVSKAIDKAAGAEREVLGVAGKSGSVRNCMAGDFTGGEYMATAPATDGARQWVGWGTALKPAWEPIVLARRPLAERTVAGQMLVTGTGALNIDACRVHASDAPPCPGGGVVGAGTSYELPDSHGEMPAGRWPANLVHDGSLEVLEAFGDESRARFFYHAKADAGDRAGSRHPTVKPIALMRWLVRMVTPPGGSVLDPFAGTGTTGAACRVAGFGCVMMEREAEYVADAARRLGLDTQHQTPYSAASS